MFDIRLRHYLLLAAVATGVWLDAGRSQPRTTTAEDRAVAFLMREVPAWSRDNGCFSCHNNGDAARALYAATRKGYRVPASALSDTTAWVERPDRWDGNTGDPGFSDKRLANVQFAAALLAAFDAGKAKDRRALARAARKVAADQGAEGAWKIDQGDSPGTPATYGTPLATYLALRTLKAANAPETQEAIQKAERWLLEASPKGSVLTAAALLLAAGETAQARQQECLERIQAAQTRDGGWGPYADSPPEPFDTAVVLLALAPLRERPGVAERIQRGRRFLIAGQEADGGWPATTRPPGGDSYAQRVSTTGWAILALLETREPAKETVSGR